jgi:hypothetical protein
MIFLRVSPSPDWFEDIALEETADGIWSVYFYDVLLARLDERDFKLYA